MKERKMEDLMIDYIEGRLSGELEKYVANHIEKNPIWKKEYEGLKVVMGLMDESPELEPDESLKFDFLNDLEKEVEGLANQIESGEAKVIGLNLNTPWRIAASILLVALGVVIGMIIMKQNDRSEEIMAELEMTKQLVINSLENQSSASQRLNGVNASYSINHADKDILYALIKAMNTDENTNVRLAAVEALEKFSGEEKVRSALIDALELQDDPIVQIRLINVMVRLKETRALQPMQNIIDREETLEAVKDEAHMGIFKLS